MSSSVELRAVEAWSETGVAAIPGIGLVSGSGEDGILSVELGKLLGGMVREGREDVGAMRSVLTRVMLLEVKRRLVDGGPGLVGAVKTVLDLQGMRKGGVVTKGAGEEAVGMGVVGLAEMLKGLEEPRG